MHSTTTDLNKNEVDSWIDELEPGKSSLVPDLTSGVGPHTLMAWMVQQYLPKVELPNFDGAPLEWVDFIVKFRDIVHKQPYLTDSQRHQTLNQHLRGEAKSSVKGYVNDPFGYVMALRTLKHLFGRRAIIARAVLERVLKGKVIGSDDRKGLSSFYYNINECLVTLKQLNYISDLHSSETLQQAVQRLPMFLQHKWSERSLSVRRTEEPNLLHLGSWLRDRLLAMKEIAPPSRHKGNDSKLPSASPKSNKPEDKHVNVVQKQGSDTAKPCDLCKSDEKHNFWRCKIYRQMEPKKKAEFVKRRKVCTNCFNVEHTLKDCASKNTCFKKGCGAKHHTSLHSYFTEGGNLLPAKDDKDAKAEKEPADNKGKEDEKKVDKNPKIPPANEKGNDVKNYCLIRSAPKTIYLLIVPVTLHAGEKHIKTYALLDDCSQATLLREDIAETLGLEGREDIFNLNTIKDNPETVRCAEVSLEISARNGKNRHPIQSVHIQPAERFNMPARPKLEDLDDNGVYTHLDGLKFDAVSPDEITILIGANFPDAHICSEVRRGENGPLAMKTIFGWTLFGPAGSVACQRKNVHCSTIFVGTDPLNSSLPPQQFFVNHLTTSREEGSLHDSVERFWLQENVGILPPKEVAMSVDDVKALQIMEKGTKLLANGHYEVPMLWDHSRLPLPDNLPLAKKRFAVLQRKLRSNQELHTKFKAQIDGYLQQDPPYARKLTKEEADNRSSKTWYLPIHPVQNPNKPGKVRVVNDGAAEYRGASLNKSLRSGPDLLNSLVGVLLRFRTNIIAIAADVEAMFHQVRVKMEDADALRFLWKDDMLSEDPADIYQMLVHIFGATDSPTCCNYALQRTARDNFTEFDALTVESVLRAFYVDDLLKSVHSVDDAIRLAKELMEMLKKTGFRLTKFLSNSKEVLGALPPSEISPAGTLQLDGEQNLQRALGIAWETNNDIFTFSFNAQLQKVVSKRSILKTTASVFDPLGFLTAFILTAKLILQSLWMQGKDWDEQVDELTQKRWNKWLQGATKLNRVQLKRCYIPAVGNPDLQSICEIQMHLFCDASELAFGCVGYLRFTFKNGVHQCSFIMSKSRLAPIKVITLPRLELNSARAGARLGHLILHEVDLPISRVQYWTDSMLTLQYITSTTNRMKVFVANRVSDILTHTQSDQWRHVPGDANTADLLTRGVDDPEQLMNNRWFSAPEFLEQDEEMWPNQKVSELDKDDVEIRKKSILVATTFVNTNGFDFTKISRWERLRRVVALIVRTCEKFKSLLSKMKNVPFSLNEGPYTVEELENVEKVIIRDVQQSAFQDEINCLRSDKAVASSSRLSKLSPFLDDHGTLRVGGRLKNIPIPVEAKHPIILPGAHLVTKVLMEWKHRKSGHVGPEHVLTILRETYWIIGGRSAMRQVCHRCFFCRVRAARVKYPFMADLQLCRAAIEEAAFSHCGLDLFGPITVKQGRKQLKRWGIIFTCMTIRCVHLDIVHSCETDSFLNALRRFTNRRGCPNNVYSDNGTNFRGASTELKEFIIKLEKDPKILDTTAAMKIKWTFNPPSAPHMGGAWERLVRSTKEVLFGLVKDHVLTDPQLYTVFTEVESIINSRPLTHLSDDVRDLEPLTPNHVLLGMHRNWSAISDTSELDIFSRRKWKQVQALRAMFWTRWIKEYLPTLAQRSRWTGDGPTFDVGELVLVKNDEVKRNKWPLGRIEKIMPGKDGVTRVVEVHTKDGTYTRPVSKVLKLEDNNFVQRGE